MYEPLHRHRPASKWTNGDLAARVGADLGLPPDDEQRWILDSIYAEVADDRPAAFEVAVIAPRQNIKTSTLGIAALADLFVFGAEKHVWSSHLLDTSKGTFRDFRQWIESNHEYADQVDYMEGHQDLSIIHRESGRRVEFRSRTGKGGRGLTSVKRITLDEALYLEPKHVGAVYPTMLTRPGAQVRIASSAGMEHSEQLRRIRDRGRTGKDPRLAYVEYGAKVKACADRNCQHTADPPVPGCAMDDRDLWWQANCALWCGRITEESLNDLRLSMPPAEWAREFFSWWEDPVSLGGALSLAKWMDLADPAAQRGAKVSFGADVAEDRTAWIAVAWERPDGRRQVMLTNQGAPLQAAKLADECARLTQAWGGTVTPPRAFEDDIDKAGSKVESMKSSDFPAACGSFADAVDGGTIRHGNQPALNEAVKAAQWRSVGTSGERAFQLKDAPEVGPLAAAVRAIRGLSASAESVYETRGLVTL